MSEDPFMVEQHGIDYIPDSERWASPKDIFGMWAGASVQIEYFIYGAILMTFGFTFAQALSLIILGNLSYPPARAVLAAGTGRRHVGLRHQPGGVRAQRLAADLLLQLDHPDRLRGRGPDPHRRRQPGADGQGRVRPRATRPRSSSSSLAVLIQGILPFLGHAAIVKSLRLAHRALRRALRGPARFRHPACAT